MPAAMLDERALHGEADGQAGGAERGENAGGLDAELAEHRHHHDDENGVAHDRGDHARQHRVDARLPVQAGRPWRAGRGRRSTSPTTSSTRAPTMRGSATAAQAASRRQKRADFSAHLLRC